MWQCLHRPSQQAVQLIIFGCVDSIGLGGAQMRAHLHEGRHLPVHLGRLPQGALLGLEAKGCEGAVVPAHRNPRLSVYIQADISRLLRAEMA